MPYLRSLTGFDIEDSYSILTYNFGQAPPGLEIEVSGTRPERLERASLLRHDHNMGHARQGWK